MVYHGSLMFSFLSDYTNVPIDQLNFLITQLIALASGFVFRAYLKPCPQNTLKRHLVVILWGILLGNFCYGKQMWHLFCQAFVSYALLLFCPRKYVHLVVLVFTMSYLAGLHIHRLIYDYGNYTLDITSPFMINTQKLTAFAFAFYDGMRKIEKLTPDQKNQAIKDCPHIIEFLSYLFNFQGIAVGPLSFYQDYIDFINGNNVLKHKKSNDSNGDTNKIVQPSNIVPVIKKFLVVILLGIGFFKITLACPIISNLDEEMLEKPFLYRLVYLYISTSSQRFKYYIAWVLGDMVNNASGFGFNGYDENNHEKWDLISNVNIFKLETATSMKVILDSWNIQTQLWLRRICFDRLPTLKTLGVFVLSAIWHGFYPGYYFAFVTCAFSVYAGRGIRRKIRPHFQKNAATKFIYEIITWIGASQMLAYSVAPFDILEFWLSIKFYNSIYWWMTIVTVAATILLPGGSTKTKKDVKKGDEVQPATDTDKVPSKTEDSSAKTD